MFSSSANGVLRRAKMNDDYKQGGPAGFTGRQPPSPGGRSKAPQKASQPGAKLSLCRKTFHTRSKFRDEFLTFVRPVIFLCRPCWTVCPALQLPQNTRPLGRRRLS